MNARKPQAAQMQALGNVDPPMEGGCEGAAHRGGREVSLPRDLKRLIEIHVLRSPAVFIAEPAWYLTKQELDLLETLRYWGY